MLPTVASPNYIHHYISANLHNGHNSLAPLSTSVGKNVHLKLSACILMFTHFYDNISFDLNGILLLQPGSSSELALTWRRLADLQYAMSWLQSTVVQGAVYVREGAEYSGDIHRYDLQTQQWTKLPLCKYCWFTIYD